jgi:hypothetical protein
VGQIGDEDYMVFPAGLGCDIVEISLVKRGTCSVSAMSITMKAIGG